MNLTTTDRLSGTGATGLGGIWNIPMCQLTNERAARAWIRRLDR
jgi:hypothetical protein